MDWASLNIGDGFVLEYKVLGAVLSSWAPFISTSRLEKAILETSSCQGLPYEGCDLGFRFTGYYHKRFLASYKHTNAALGRL